MPRFLIVDDHPLFREALESAVRMTNPEADILQATSIESALDVMSAWPEIDLALLDLSLPGTQGFSGVVQIRAQRPKLPVIVVSGHEDPKIIREALALGIAGYIPKSMSKKQLADGIRDVLNGSIYVPAHLLPQGVQAEPDAELQSILARLRDLTPQQLRVLEMIREGLQNKQIAFELKVAETTVKAHVSEILRKLNVFSRTRAVILLQKIDFDAISSRA